MIWYLIGPNVIKKEINLIINKQRKIFDIKQG